MSLRSTIYLHGIWPATNVTLRGLARRLRGWEQAERRSLAENQELQWQALRRLLRHAYDSSPFYRARMQQAGLDPAAMRHPGELEKLPPLTREDLRQHLDTIISDRYPRTELFPAATGGTTDTPVAMLRDRTAVAEKVAAQEAFQRWTGLQPGDRVLWLWGAVQDYAAKPSWRWRLYDYHLMRRLWLPGSRFNPEVLGDYRRRLNEFRPRAIVAYPTPLELLCEYLEAEGGDYWRPQIVVCTAETLFPRQRERIERVLGCRVFEHYGAREFGMIGAECEAHDGMHFNPLTAYVEFRPLGAGTGASGGPQEMLITDLLNFGMPLIRYQVNDCAEAGVRLDACACGRGYPRVSQVLGRTADVVRLPNGDMLPGVDLDRVLKGIEGLTKTQYIQESPYQIRLRYVALPGFDALGIEQMRRQLAVVFPPGLQWEFEAVAEIPREASGKTRFCISHVASPMSASDCAPGAR